MTRLPHDRPTPVHDQQDLPAMTRLLQVMDAHDQAHRDPRLESRWGWRRQAAITASWAADILLQDTERRTWPMIVDEAAAVVARTCPPPRAWMRPEPAMVADQLTRSSHGRLTLPLEQVIRYLYRDDTVHLDHDDLLLLEEHIAAADPSLRTLVATRSYHDRPHESAAMARPGHDDQVRAALTGPATLLPRPVVVYRGERPSRRDPQFTRAAREARPGSILHRGDLPLSASIDPAAASFVDFCGIGPATTNRTGHEGWILAITTTHALYTGTRATWRGRRDPLAEEEKEVLVHAPHLHVTAVTDTLITDTRWGDKRAHIIHATPTPAHHPGAPSPSSPNLD